MAELPRGAKKKKPKPAPIEVPVPEIQYELCVRAPASLLADRTHSAPAEADAHARRSSLDGTFRDFKNNFEISRGGLRLAGVTGPGLGLGRTPSSQDLCILGSDPDLWTASRPQSAASASPSRHVRAGTRRAHMLRA